MKLNAHELAMNRWPDNKGTELGSSASDGQLGARIGCVFAITEVAQPLQDRVEELKEALEYCLNIMDRVPSKDLEVLDHPDEVHSVKKNARAILAKHA